MDAYCYQLAAAAFWWSLQSKYYQLNICWYSYLVWFTESFADNTVNDKVSAAIAFLNEIFVRPPYILHLSVKWPSVVCDTFSATYCVFFVLFRFCFQFLLIFKLNLENFCRNSFYLSEPTKCLRMDSFHFVNRFVGCQIQRVSQLLLLC